MGTALLFFLPQLVSLVVFLLVGVVLYRVWRRSVRGEPLFRAPRRGAVWGVVVVALLGVSLFTGFVGAAVIGALAPRSVMFAADMACPGVVSHDSVGYSYKPGQRGVAQVFTCTVAGEERDIILATFGYAGLTFSAAAFAVLLLLAVTVGPRLPGLLRFALGRLSARSADVAGAAAMASVVTDAMKEAAAGLAAGAGAAPPRAAATASATPTGGGSAGRGLGERLRELEELYRAGSITRAEYETARARLLAEL